MMATSRKNSAASHASTPPDAPSGATTPHGYAGHNDHSFTLQAIMEMQKSVGALESAVNGLTTQIGSQKQSMDDLKKKVGHVEKVMYAAGVILLIGLSLAGWLLSTAKDFAMTYYKASLDAQVKQQATVVPPPLKK